MYGTWAAMLVLIRWQKRHVPGQAQAMDDTNNSDILYSTSQDSKTGWKCGYDQRPVSNSAHRFCLICWKFKAALWQKSTQEPWDGYLWCSPSQGSSLRLLWQRNRHQNLIKLHRLFTDIRAVTWYGLPIKSGGLKFTLPSEMPQTLVL